MSEVVPRLKEWVEGLAPQRPYSVHAWCELSKGRWEARNHGLPKDVVMRPSSGDEDVPFESPSPRQGDEKKRKRASISPNSEKKNQKEGRASPREALTLYPRTQSTG
uniref:Uncharacterized protein LOC104249177 n=1 Tax=Nicotiana sylvestris TaxID=4096 RepID=A0A1U7YXG1_NICSY|nr:PREDICTED: uncharacterized protein LOC104249177 [Nicotiana sylvestris]